LHVLYVTPGYPPFVGGGEAYVGALAAEMVRRGHRVTVVTSDAASEPDLWRARQTPRKRTESTKDGVCVVHCPTMAFPGGFPALTAWRKAMVVLSALPGDASGLLLRMARSVPPIEGFQESVDTVADADLIHGFNISWEHPLLCGWLSARRRGTPYVVTPFAHLGSGTGDRVARNHTMDHQLRVLSDADAVLVLTRAEAQGLASYGIEPERLAVVGGGVDAPEARPSDTGEVAGTVARLGLRLPLVLFVGRVCRDKGAIQAARAVLDLHEKGMDLSLALVGRPAAGFQRFYRTLGPQQRQIVRVLGSVDERTKHLLLDACSLLVLPSRADSFGIVILEAWGHGKPVVGARAGGIPSVIDDERDGLLVAYGDRQDLATKIAYVLEHPLVASEMGSRGRHKTLRTYTWEAVGERVEQVYERVTSFGSAARGQPGSLV